MLATEMTTVRAALVVTTTTTAAAEEASGRLLDAAPSTITLLLAVATMILPTLLLAVTTPSGLILLPVGLRTTGLGATSRHRIPAMDPREMEVTRGTMTAVATGKFNHSHSALVAGL
jgi:hypothetical protein